MASTTMPENPETFVTANFLAEQLHCDPRSIARPADAIVHYGKRTLPVYRITPSEIQNFIKLKAEIFGQPAAAKQ